jgi:hypothetical protein
MKGCLDPFFDCTIVLFSLLLRICKVHVDSKIVEHCILERLEFVVSLDLGDLESCLVVDCDNFFECFCESNNGLALNVLSGPVVQVL